MDSLTPDLRSTQDVSPVVARARALGPLFRSHATANEAAGLLADETVEALRNGGFFGLTVPKSLGGLEASPTEILQVYETISEADAPTGWVLMASNVATGSAGGYLPPAGARTVFGPGVPVIAGVGIARGRADVEGKGFRLTGRWSYGSGLLHSDWIHTGGTVYENGQPRLLPGSQLPETRIFIVPSKDAEFLGNWDTLGLRATGSIDYAVKDLYVPEEMTHAHAAVTPNQGGNFYKLGIGGMASLGHGGVPLGLGRRILDELCIVANAEVGRPTAMLVPGGGESFHEHYAVAEAKFRSARAFLYEVVRDVEETLGRGDPVSTRHLTLLRLSVNHATTVASEISAFAHRAESGAALRSGDLQRLFRDMYSVTQHHFVSDRNLTECGRELIGRAKGQVWTNRGLVTPPPVKP